MWPQKDPEGGLVQYWQYKCAQCGGPLFLAGCPDDSRGRGRFVAFGRRRRQDPQTIKDRSDSVSKKSENEKNTKEQSNDWTHSKHHW